MLQLGYIRLLNGWIRQRAFSDIRKQKLFMPKEIWVMPKTGEQEEQAYEKSCIKQDGIQQIQKNHKQ